MPAAAQLVSNHLLLLLLFARQTIRTISASTQTSTSLNYHLYPVFVEITVVRPCKERQGQNPDATHLNTFCIHIKCVPHEVADWKPDDGLGHLSLVPPACTCWHRRALKYHLIWRAKQVWRPAKGELRLQCWHCSLSSFTCYLLAVCWWYSGNGTMFLSYSHYCPGLVSLLWTQRSSVENECGVRISSVLWKTHSPQFWLFKEIINDRDYR